MLIILKKDTYEVYITNKADKSLHKIAKKDKGSIKTLLKAIKNIAKDPYDSKTLKGKLKGNRRVRNDPYRIIFQIDNNLNQINILEVERRNKVYKKI